ncbi:calcium-binding protein [Gloeocapsopsis dulcis]|uniref:Calcium-binding protein n=1 Tax=Gloeocapsopsis dulcis AAB1 = 1H9 TaxID=1433147 RepID=A0A6N8FPY6_9CHRO|nr:calcium-binding protein [Gloeocapsopsis dulcis]MUL34934.1 hypothetical protein [Gloeocapsopsis dulcis AAB1 = 1H9]WNN89994.1 calcium-binding protein [Gloeocapsopsis dulcis]
MVEQVFRGITYTVKTATSNNQTLWGTPKPDWLAALGGNNQVFAGAGNDVVLAGVSFTRIGNYDLYGGEAIFYNPLPNAGNNKVFAGSGNDYVATGAGNDVVYLGEGNDIFDGANGGNDTIYAGAGNDIIDVGGLGKKTVYAGAGNDIINALYAGSNSVIYAGAGNDNIVFVPSAFPNDPGKPLINGGQGDNNILAAGNSRIITGEGDDLIGVDSGSGLVCAGGGADTIFTASFTSSGDSLVYGGSGNDTIVSGTGSDTIYAGGGNDTINLRGGVVDLRGFLVDTLNTDSVYIPGGGNDIVYAGKGRDTYILGTGAGVTTIYGYESNERIDLTGLGLSMADVSLTQSSADALLSVGSDQLAILKWTDVNAVSFFV